MFEAEKTDSRNISTLGQVFTPPEIVKRMLSLRKNKGHVLEPSAGHGAFMAALGGRAVGIEIDAKVVTDKQVKVCDFFSYALANKFDSVIGNPPYVRFQDICQRTKNLLIMDWFDRRTNLYLFFIAKSMEHLEDGGELIFITPRDFIKSTNAKRLNEELYKQGTITHFYDLGDAKVFGGVSPNCAIWRWEKGRMNRKTAMGNVFCYRNGQIWFGKHSGCGTVADHFSVKVGAVSGADKVFKNNEYGNVKMVCSRTRTDGYERVMIYNKNHHCLSMYRKSLMARRIRKFDESNWWEWGRAYHHQEGPRIYVNCKTRTPKPFFVSDTKAYDGSVLALFPHNGIDIGKAANKLNAVDWEALGFVCGGRLMFTQHSLAHAPVEDLG